MEIKEAVAAFDALSQETRLEGFRVLVKHGRDGMPAGKLSKHLGIPANTLSFHLNQMRHANLVIAQRKGRSIRYIANLEFTNQLLNYMLEHCCSMEHSRTGSDTNLCRSDTSFSSAIPPLRFCQE